ncbi:hypothetical protein C8J57DRAFT_1056666, partial [Mycena rebaudengoi]
RVTRGIHGFLRQELREIEILDEITRLRYEGSLPRHVTGLYRRHLLRAYQLWKGDTYEVPNLHPAIHWEPEMGPRIPIQSEYDKWVPALVHYKNKKQRSDREEPPMKKHKSNSGSVPDLSSVQVIPPTLQSQVRTPWNTVVVNVDRGLVAPLTGLVWDNNNFSCAYDSFFTVLWSLWQEAPVVHTPALSELSSEMSVLVRGFDQVLRGLQSLESVRDDVRTLLHATSPRLFPMGHQYASVSDVAASMLSRHTYGSATVCCELCGYQLEGVIGTFFLHLTMGCNVVSTVKSWLQSHLQKRVQYCPRCLAEDNINLRMLRTTTVDSVPPLLFLSIPSTSVYSLDPILDIVSGSRPVRMSLRGVIYLGGNHFTARLISGNGDVRFHDGITTGRRTVYEGNLNNSDFICDLQKAGSMKAVAAVYC